MSDTVQIIVGLIVLVGVYLLSRKVHVWRMQRAYKTVLSDLEQKKAFNPASAVHLPYAKTGLFKIGTRDYRPKAIQYMTQTGIAAMTENGNFYLLNRNGIPNAEDTCFISSDASDSPPLR